MSLPTEMTCVEIAEPGGPEQLRITTRPVPAPAKGEVLIKVAAAGVNRPDVVQRLGHYAPTEQCLPVPKGLSMVEAAALPETFFTVWTNLYERGDLKPGETLMVHGGTSGIGTTAIQVASRLGAKVIATAGSAEKCQACLALGAERAVNYREEDFVEAAKDFTGGKGVDVILDMVGGDYIEKNLKSLNRDGRLVNIAFMKGAKAEINFMPLMLKRLTITGSTLRAQSVARKGVIARAVRENVWPLIEKGEVKPVIYKTFSLNQAREAHELMESNRHIGKIVFQVAE